MQVILGSKIQYKMLTQALYNNIDRVGIILFPLLASSAKQSNLMKPPIILDIIYDWTGWRWQRVQKEPTIELLERKKKYWGEDENKKDHSYKQQSPPYQIWECSIVTPTFYCSTPRGSISAKL